MSNEKSCLRQQDSWTARRTLNRATRGAAGKSYEQILTEIDAPETSFRQAVKSQYDKKSE
jgi:hypothetical protein